jgi:hypothetical protein
MTTFATSDKVTLTNDIEDSVITWLKLRAELNGVTIVKEQEETKKIFPNCQVTARIMREHPRGSGIYQVRVSVQFEWKPVVQTQQPAAWAVILGMLHWDVLPSVITNTKVAVYDRAVIRLETGAAISGDRHSRNAAITIYCRGL